MNFTEEETKQVIEELFLETIDQGNLLRRSFAMLDRIIKRSIDFDGCPNCGDGWTDDNKLNHTPICGLQSLMDELEAMK